MIDLSYNGGVWLEPGHSDRCDEYYEQWAVRCGWSKENHPRLRTNNVMLHHKGTPNGKLEGGYGWATTD